MQVQSINNQNRNIYFGTKVTFNKDTLALINQLPKDTKKTLRGAIQQLRNDGIADKLNICIPHCYDGFGEKKQVILAQIYAIKRIARERKS